MLLNLHIRILPSAIGLVSATVAADTVVLENGDRLSGTVVKIEATSLWLDTAYAGTLKLPWAQVRQIASDQPVRVRLADGTELDGQLQSGGDRQVRIRIGSLAETAPLGLDRVSAINPPRNPDQTVVKGWVSVGGNLTSGNTDSKTLHLAGEVVARHPGERVTLGAELKEASQNGLARRQTGGWI